MAITATHMSTPAILAHRANLTGPDRETVRLQRWREFREWGIDGLCTDYALEARRFFGG